MPIERYIGKYFSTLIRSFNPDYYSKLLEERMKFFVRFFLITLSIALTLFVVLFVAVSLQYIRHLPQTLDEVQQFQVSGRVEADHPVVIMSNPGVVLDLNAENAEDDYDFVLTREGVIYPRYIFFGSTFIEWGDLSDFKNPTSERDTLLGGLVIFLLPSVIFWFSVYSVLKLFVIFLVLLLLGYYIPRIVKYYISLKETGKIAVLAMPSVTIIGVGLYPLAPRVIFWWGFLLTLVVFTLSIALMSNKKIKRR